MRTPGAGLVAWLALLAAAGCAGDDPAPSTPPALEGTVVLHGEPLGANIEWGELEFFDVASDGRVAAVDRYRRRIVVIGDSITEFGSAGDGPGELQLGGPIVLIGDTIVIADEGRLTSWTTRGAHLASAAGVYGAQLYPHPTAGLILVTPVTGLAPDGVRVSARSAAGLELLVPPVLLGEDDPVCGGCQAVPIGRDEYVAAPQDPDRGPRFVGPAEDLEWVYPVDRVPWEAVEWGVSMRRQRARVVQGTNDLRLREIFSAPSGRTPEPPAEPKRLVRFNRGLGVSGEIVLLLAQVEVGQASAVDIFSRRGDYLGRASLGRPDIEWISVEGRWLVGLARDEFDRPTLWRYEISEVTSADRSDS